MIIAQINGSIFCKKQWDHNQCPRCDWELKIIKISDQNDFGKTATVNIDKKKSKQSKVNVLKWISNRLEIVTKTGKWYNNYIWNNWYEWFEWHDWIKAPDVRGAGHHVDWISGFLDYFSLCLRSNMRWQGTIEGSLGKTPFKSFRNSFRNLVGDRFKQSETRIKRKISVAAKVSNKKNYIDQKKCGEQSESESESECYKVVKLSNKKKYSENKKSQINALNNEQKKNGGQSESECSKVVTEKYVQWQYSKVEKNNGIFITITTIIMILITIYLLLL